MGVVVQRFSFDAADLHAGGNGDVGITGAQHYLAEFWRGLTTQLYTASLASFGSALRGPKECPWVVK